MRVRQHIRAACLSKAWALVPASRTCVKLIVSPMNVLIGSSYDITSHISERAHRNRVCASSLAQHKKKDPEPNS